jgi:16S rRNA (cytosine1402-N4)-methyltransferase
MRVFQALRIAVNDELGVIREALPKALSLLIPKGVLLVISFHSLEDRIVKQTFLDFEKKRYGRIITKKLIIASAYEVSVNRRSRSAKMRVFEKM